MKAKMKSGRRALLKTALALGLIGAVGVGYAYFSLTSRTQGNTFDSTGVKIHYTVEGEGAPVILLHGFAVNADLNFRRPGITDLLARNHQVIAVDTRGHGLSGKPGREGPYGMEMALDVIRLMDHLDIEKADLVGYSLGGFLALKLAVEQPERVRKVAAMGSGWERPEKSRFLDALKGLEEALVSGESIGPLAEKLGHDRKPTWIHSAWVKLMTGYFNDRDAMIGVIRGLPELAISEEEIRGLTIPILSVVGELDPMLVGAEALVGNAPDHRLVVVEGADHVRATFSPVLHRALVEFLAKDPI
jgi:pimeloyl-ACP methyl ester carboxylesterase